MNNLTQLVSCKNKNQRFVFLVQRRYLGILLFLIFGTIPLTSINQERKSFSTKETHSASVQRKLDYFFYEGLALKNAGKYDAAFEAFRHCHAIDSTASAVLFELSSYYLQLQQPEKAAHLMKKAVEYEPENFTYKNVLASLYLNLGMFGEAAEAYESLSQMHPEKMELKYFLAESLIQQGEIGKAIDLFNELEEMIGMSEPLSMQKFRLYMTLEQPEKAFHELKKLADKFPDNARFPLLIGDLYLDKKDTIHALEYYQRAKEIDAGNPFYTISMANYYEMVGNTEAAEEQIRSALVNDDLEVEIKVGILARYIHQLQQSKQGMEGANVLFKTLLEQHPEDVELKLMYGTLLASIGQMEEARFQFQLATEMDPSNQKAWQQLLNLSFQTQNLEEAVRVCLKGQELFPEAYEYYFYLGIAYFQQNKYQEALDTYYAGLKIIPEENRTVRSDFYGQIGDIYFQMKQPDQAFASYEEALKYNEKNVMILNNYSYYLALEKKDLDKAERMSAQCIKIEPNNSTYLDTYAWIFFVKGNYVLAKIYIENALEKDNTQNPELYDHYGDILFKTGDVEGAVKQWTKAKELGKKGKILDQKIAERIYIEDSGYEE